MPLVTFFRKPPKLKGVSKTDAWALFEKKVELIKEKYTDITGRITDEAAYYSELAKLYAENLNNPAFTLTRQNDVLTGYREASRKLIQATAFPYKLGKEGIKQIDEELNDYWTNLWSLYSDGVSALSKQDPIGLADAMLSQIEEIDGAISELRTTALESGAVSEETLDEIDMLSEAINNKKTFWRGVLTDPDRYAVKIDTVNGKVTNFEIVDRVPEGYKKINATYGPLTIVAKPDMNDKINIGGNVFKNVGSGMPYEFDKEDEQSLFETPTFDNLDRYTDDEEGTIMKSPDGRFFVIGPNRQAVYFPDKSSLDETYHMTLDDNQIKVISKKEANRIASMYETRSITEHNEKLSREKRNREIQQKVEAAATYKNPTFKEYASELPVLGQSIAFTGAVKSGIKKVLKETEPATHIVGKAAVEAGEVSSKTFGKLVSPVIKFAGKQVEKIKKEASQIFAPFKY